MSALSDEDAKKVAKAIVDEWATMAGRGVIGWLLKMAFGALLGFAAIYYAKGSGG